MKKEIETLLVVFNKSETHDITTCVVGSKEKNKIKMLNILTGSDAEAMYELLTMKKEDGK